MKTLMIAFSILVLVLSNCSIPSKPDDSTINDIKDKLIYFRDNRGLCYTAIESSTYMGYKVISITNIPC